jgi:acyl transferase domain-containing protein/NAD(P)H-dependent flavin oxidoreductase YrpB (nitropropane dioxygenase family)
MQHAGRPALPSPSFLAAKFWSGVPVLVDSAVRDLVIAISPCGALEPSPHVISEASRGGGLGVIDLADGGPRPLRALTQCASWSPAPIGIRIPAGCAASMAEVQRSAAGAVGLAVLGAGTPWGVGETASWCRVLVEVTSQQEARTAAALGAHGLIARGMESGGRVSDLSTFVLLQQLLEDGTVSLPVWAAGGVGLRTAAACVLGGAAGVVLDSQLALMPESELPGDVMRVLRRLDGSETVMSPGQRGVRVVGRPARIAGPRDPEEDTTLLPIGQDGQLAATFAARWRDTASAVRGLRSAILETAADDVAGHALAPGAPLASALGVRIPVAQGPMTRVSDQAGFAAAVAGDGAMPFIALALADGERSRRMLLEVAAALGKHPWGVGVLGFVPEELRAAQLQVILDIKPAWAIVAGGRPAQAKELEQAGIAAFLHVPSPGLLRQFLGSGVRRFVFEGAECGGHIGPRASFPLWEAQIEVIEEFLDTRPAEEAAQVQVLFAGGIHSGRSAAMVAAMAAPLTRRGARIGVLMGTAYLFTQEALDHGAIVPLFQRMALEADGTALLETSPGHVTRALRTPFVDEFARQRAELEAAGAESRDIWMRLEMLNTGRLRLASKGLEHDGAEIDEATQAAEGLYMAGQIAVLRDAVTTVPALHAEVTTGASGFHHRRRDELRPLAAGRGEDMAGTAAGPLDIAIVGMAGVFAGSTGLDGFWRTILSGQDQFTEVPAGRWDPAIYYTPDFAAARVGRRVTSKWGGFLQPVPIDPIRYGIPPSALGSIDPSQLLALEVANQALNDAGYSYDAPGADHSRTGVVFAAEPGSDDGGALALRALLPAYLGDVPPELDEQLPTFTEDTFPGHLSNVVAGRIANRFDLGGTNYTVDAACAASLAALDVACKQLSTGSADMMLCGAVDLHNSIGDFLMFGSVYALSPRGRIATFDSAADGTALGEGVACLTLKRLADAERDGDRIYAVIKGLGAASDGRARSLIAPRVAGQIRAMRRAYRQAGISPAEVGLVEAHGTGTLLGDQTELDSLTEVFTESGARPGGCVLGSVKSQIGHTKSAAGLAGLIKAALGVYYGVQPPTSNLASPNKAWDPETSPFAFLKEPRPWLAPPAERLAGLSAFGFGGTNFHVVLGGHAGSPVPRHAVNEWPAELFCFRGPDRPTAHQAVQRLASTAAAAAARPGGAVLRELAARAALDAEAAAGPVQVALVARDVTELGRLLERALAGEHDPAAALIQPPPDQAPLIQPQAAGATPPPAVAFLYPGQGSQRTGALGELFVAFPELRHYLEIGRRWADRLLPVTAFDPARQREQSDQLRDTRVAQPALGICGLAVSHLLGRTGVRPDMSGGHSYGELVALSTAGAFDPLTLLDLSDARATAILTAAGEDPGTMAAVPATASEVTAALAAHGLSGDVTLANLNAPGQVVISGPTQAVDRALAALREAGLKGRLLPVACAFHSPVVAAASAQFSGALATREIAPPALPVWSNRTAAPYPADPGLIRAELAAQVSAPVRFSDQVEAMYAAGARVFVEAGPGQVLTGLVRAVLGERPHLAVACDGPPGQGLRRFLTTLGQLACAGLPVNLNWLFHGRTRADAGPSTNGRSLWTVDGQLIRDVSGGFLPGANTPARLIKEFPVSASNSHSPAVPDSMLAEYLRTSREMITAQRDIMLAFLGGQPAGRMVWEPQAAGLPAGNGAAHPVAVGAAEPVAVAAAAPAPAAAAEPAAETAGPAASAPPTVAELQSTVLTLISERTGYPVDLIDPDLDLEADLSIDSIKRAEIAGEMASRLGMLSLDTAESMFEDLVKARTVRAIADWLGQAVSGADGPAGTEPAGTEPPGTEPAGTGPDAAAPPEAGQDALAGAGVLRSLPRLSRLDGPGQPPGSLHGARFLLTGDTPVAEQLAGKLRELGAEARATGTAAVTVEDVQAADGLILLDGLSGTPATATLPPALFPLIKGSLTGTAPAGTGTGQRWLLAAGYAGHGAAAGLTGLFRAIALEYPDGLARYVELDRAAPAAGVAGLLLGELGDGTREPAVTYAGDARHRVELDPAELRVDGAAATGPAAAAALGLTSDSVVLLVGGGRGITALLARELAAASQCRIELVGRTPLPAEPLPGDLASAPDAVSLRVARAGQGLRKPAEIERATRDILARREVESTLAELRGLGSAVRYHPADAQDAEAIHQVLKLIREDHGRLDGVVYAAGIIEDRLIADKDPGSFTRVFQTKVGGAQLLLDALAGPDYAPSFAVLYGSIAATFGSRGQADYAAANDALESAGRAWASRTGRRCLTVHWGPWAPDRAHPGMVTPELSREYGRRGLGMIDPGCGALAVLHELAWGDPALRSVVYTGLVSDAG